VHRYFALGYDGNEKNETLIASHSNQCSGTTGNHEVFEGEVNSEEAFTFLGKLVSSQDIIYLAEPHGSLDFWRHEDFHVAL